VLAWHLATKDQDYAFARPGLVAHKRRKLELTAGDPSRRGSRSQPASAYSSKQRRDQERQAVEQAEPPTRSSSPPGSDLSPRLTPKTALSPSAQMGPRHPTARMSAQLGAPGFFLASGAGPL